jgi:hypothetical protein
MKYGKILLPNFATDLLWENMETAQSDSEALILTASSLSDALKKMRRLANASMEHDISLQSPYFCDEETVIGGPDDVMNVLEDEQIVIPYDIDPLDEPLPVFFFDDGDEF